MHGLPSEKSEGRLKQLLDFADPAFVDQKQDDMIIGFNDDIIMGDDDVATSDDGADIGARWQIDFLDFSTHDL